MYPMHTTATQSSNSGAIIRVIVHQTTIPKIVQKERYSDGLGPQSTYTC